MTCQPDGTERAAAAVESLVRRSCVAALASFLLLVGCGSTTQTAVTPSNAADRADATAASPVIEASIDESSRTSAHGALPGTSAPTTACPHYTPENMARSTDFAFDGTVVGLGEVVYRRSIGMTTTSVDFNVNQWFAGGSQKIVRILVPTGGSIDPTAPPFELETQLLVSGFTQRAGGPPGDYAAGCGSTRYFDSKTATAWRRAEARSPN